MLQTGGLIMKIDNVPGTLTRKVINLTKNVTHFSRFFFLKASGSIER